MTDLRIGVVVAFSALSGFLLGTLYARTTADPPQSGATPPACIRALDYASEGFDAASDAITALELGDRRAASEATGRLEDLAGDGAVGEANRECRAGE